ncbi:MAG: hypothetical protein U1A27_08675 [Phycisphaerae bacterium]
MSPRGVATALGALVAGVAAMLLLVAAFGYPVGAVAEAFCLSAAGSWPRVAATLLLACPLLILSQGQVLCLRSNVWNIGAEGQYLVGAAAGGLAVAAGAGRCGALAPLIVLLAGSLGGGAWAGIAAALRRYRGVQEVLSTILLNFVAAQVLSILVRGPLVDPASADRDTTALLPGAARLPILDRATGLHAGVLLAAALAPLMWLFLNQTIWGYRARVCGANPQAATLAGISARRYAAAALVASGALSGLAGAIELAGNTHYLAPAFGNGYGYTAVAVALLARGGPLAALPGALFFAALESGATGLQKMPGAGLHDFPTVLTFAAQGVVVLVMLLLNRAAPRRPEVAT